MSSLNERLFSPAVQPDGSFIAWDPSAPLGYSLRQVDHGEVLNNGTNTHAQIDAFVESKGQPDGLATLDIVGKIPNEQLPAPTETLPGALLGSTEQWQTILGTGAAPDLRGETTGTHNVAIGRGALEAAVGGINTFSNTAVGTFGLSYLTEGATNTGLGYDAGTGLTTGSASTFVGNSAGTTKPDCLHAIALGSGAMADSDGQLALSSFVTHIKATGLASAADGTGTLLAIDASGHVRKAGGTPNTVAGIDALAASKQDLAEKDQPNGYLGVDGNAKVPVAALITASGATGVWTGNTTTPSDRTMAVMVYDTLDGRLKPLSPSVIATYWHMGAVADAINALFVQKTDIGVTEAIDTRLITAEGDIAALEGETAALDTRLTTAEADIVALEGKVGLGIWRFQPTTAAVHAVGTSTYVLAASSGYSSEHLVAGDATRFRIPATGDWEATIYIMRSAASTASSKVELYNHPLNRVIGAWENSISTTAWTSVGGTTVFRAGLGQDYSFRHVVSGSSVSTQSLGFASFMSFRRLT